MPAPLAVVGGVANLAGKVLPDISLKHRTASQSAQMWFESIDTAFAAGDLNRIRAIANRQRLDSFRYNNSDNKGGFGGPLDFTDKPRTQRDADEINAIVDYARVVMATVDTPPLPVPPPLVPGLAPGTPLFNGIPTNGIAAPVASQGPQTMTGTFGGNIAADGHSPLPFIIGGIGLVAVLIFLIARKG